MNAGNGFPQGGMAGLILHNASVLTGGEIGKASAVACKDGQIALIGRDEEVLSLAGDGAQIIDCRGRPLLPGFVDAHVHLLGYAGTFFGVDCGPPRATSIEAIQSLIRERAGRTPPGEWIRAFGYHQFFLDEERHPTRWDLDTAAPRNPVRLLHQNRHICVLNSCALQAARITRRTPNPPGGMIEKDASGEPTGLLVGMYPWLSQFVIPPLSRNELLEGLRLASESFLSQGVTCVHDASPTNGLSEWELYASLKGSEVLPLRMRMMAGPGNLAAMLKKGFKCLHGDPYLRLGPAKIAVEEIGDRLYPSPSEITAQVRWVHDAGFQVAIHAITPKAIRAATGAINALGEGEGEKRRHRLEHCTYLSPALVREIADVGAVVVVQPSFLFYNGSRYLAEVPVEKFPWVCRVGSLLRRDVVVVGSTDCPVVPNSVLTGIDVAVNRESQIGFIFGPREQVSVPQALKMFTSSGAYAAFEENVIGSIEVGHYADLVLLDKDPFKIQSEEIRHIRPVMTVVGGKVVWEASPLV